MAGSSAMIILVKSITAWLQCANNGESLVNYMSIASPMDGLRKKLLLLHPGAQKKYLPRINPGRCLLLLFAVLGRNLLVVSLYTIFTPFLQCLQLIFMKIYESRKSWNPVFIGLYRFSYPAYRHMKYSLQTSIPSFIYLSFFLVFSMVCGFPISALQPLLQLFDCAKSA